MRLTDPTFIDRLRRPLAAAIAVLLLVGLSTVASRDDDDDADTLLADQLADVSDSIADGSAAPGVDRGGSLGPGPSTPPVSGDTSSSASTSTTTSPEVTSTIPAATTTPPDTTPAAPFGHSVAPAAGSYVYDMTVTEEGQDPQESEAEMAVAYLSGDRTSAELKVEETVDDETSYQHLSWGPDGVFVRSAALTPDTDAEDRCEWDPPMQIYSRMEDGATWSGASACDTSVYGFPAHVDTTVEGRVLGRTEATFGGGSVQVWRIERTTTSRITATVGASELTQDVEETSTVLLDPTRGLVLSLESTTVLTGTQNRTIHVVRQLRP